MEAFIYSGSILAEHICNIFNLCLKHGYMPSACMQATIVPLVKCKSGNLTDVNNYRAITLSNSVTKIFEYLFLDKIKSYAQRMIVNLVLKQIIQLPFVLM